MDNQQRHQQRFTNIHHVQVLKIRLLIGQITWHGYLYTWCAVDCASVTLANYLNLHMMHDWPHDLANKKIPGSGDVISWTTHCWDLTTSSHVFDKVAQKLIAYIQSTNIITLRYTHTLARPVDKPQPGTLTSSVVHNYVIEGIVYIVNHNKYPK